ncbi:hypothetical protein BACT_1080 [Bifidobacterium actinocoloniiforme DSM 22766]|uniref:Uncharacterized protein n=1 Tax=Bifidobacterium actinocoloniiforme DSM 22766 TaxID=1437605 RepID=A0A086Z1H8_9BIFI|nr:hypothetical protein BACT_1080 [Bifidobacterium actinocoloniiforme DSM 22766]
MQPPQTNQLQGIERQLTRIADTMAGQGMQVDRTEGLFT